MAGSDAEHQLPPPLPGAGRTPRTALLSGEKTTVPLDVMQPLALEPFDQVYLLRRVRYADGRAICYCENHCLPQRVPALLSHDPTAA